MFWTKPTSIAESIKSVPLGNKKISDSCRSKLFEDAVDYLVNSKLTIPDLLDQIVGLNNSDCIVFKKLSIDNSWFFRVEISQEITHLICVCYIKNLYIQSKKVIQPIINPEELKKWLLNLSTRYEALAAKLTDRFIDNVQIAYGKITFDNNTMQLPLSKFVKYSAPSINNYSKNTQKYKELYNNHDGRCLGITNYWLITMAESYQETRLVRQHIKNNYFQSLTMQDITGAGESVQYRIKNNKVNVLIDNLQKSINLGNDFNHMQDVISTSSRFSKDLASLIDSIVNNNIGILFMQIITNDHAMGAIVLNQKNLVKVFIYDPNDHYLYRKIYIDPQQDTINILDNLINKLPYFQEEKGNPFSMILKTYTYKIAYPPLSSIGIPMRQVSDHCDNLLKLGVSSNYEALVIHAINNGASAPLSLIMAIDFLFIDIVDILIKSLPDIINYIDQEHNTPLCHACMAGNLKIVKVLLSAGAKIKVPGANSPIETAKFYKNTEVYNFLINYSCKF
ncbi:MAG: ankyrin repeat domain-containing protein [Burkholderiales bacterium]|nr:ankyrin repeat domain-containing protein [Burkholderiales bacterium]